MIYYGKSGEEGRKRVLNGVITAEVSRQFNGTYNAFPTIGLISTGEARRFRSYEALCSGVFVGTLVLI